MREDLETYAVKRSKEYEEFVKQALDIVVNSETPADIFDKAEFLPIEDDYLYVFVARGNVETNYSGQAGQKRKERYYSKNSNGQLVEHTKTVIDWYPVSGKHLYSGTSYVEGSTKDSKKTPTFDLKLLSNYEPYSKNLGFETGVPAKLPDENYEMLKNILKYKGELDTVNDIKKSYDQIKNFHYSSLVSVDTLEEYIVPITTMRINYDNKEYSISGFAIADADIKDELPNVSVYIDNETKEHMHFKFIRPLIINSVISLIEIISLYLLFRSSSYSIVSYNGSRILNQIGAQILRYIVSVTPLLQVAYYIIFKYIFDKRRKSIVKVINEKKKQSVTKILTKYNL